MIQYSVGTVLNLLGLATTETKEQLAIGQKTENESFEDRKDTQKKSPCNSN